MKKLWDFERWNWFVGRLECGFFYRWRESERKMRKPGASYVVPMVSEFSLAAFGLVLVLVLLFTRRHFINCQTQTYIEKFELKAFWVHVGHTWSRFKIYATFDFLHNLKCYFAYLYVELYTFKNYNKLIL